MSQGQKLPATGYREKSRFSALVRTFYDPLKNLRDDRLLELWCENWRCYGWQVEVVGLKEAEALDSDRFARWRTTAALYPPGAERDYPFRCYARWLTMLGGGFMVDFDVFNYGLTPRMVEDITRMVAPDRVIHFSGDATPCAGYGTMAAFRNYCQVFDDFAENPTLTTEHLKECVHDLNILQANRHVWQPIKLCSLYPRDELWDRYPLTHFTHGRVEYPRSRHIMSIRPFQIADANGAGNSATTPYLNRPRKSIWRFWA